MKVRIIEAGYEGFTGYFGTVEFVDGVSVDASLSEIRTISAVVKIVDADTGNEVGVLADFSTNQETRANAVTLPTVAELQAQAVESGETTEEPKVVAQPEKEGPKYSKGDLERIADGGGINALRKVGDEFGVKATGINKLITAILIAQGLNVEVPADSE